MDNEKLKKSPACLHVCGKSCRSFRTSGLMVVLKARQCLVFGFDRYILMPYSLEGYSMAAGSESYPLDDAALLA